MMEKGREACQGGGKGEQTSRYRGTDTQMFTQMLHCKGIGHPTKPSLLTFCVGPLMKRQYFSFLEINVYSQCN